MHYFIVPTKSPLSSFFLFGLFQFWGFFVVFFSLINMQFDFPYLTQDKTSDYAFFWKAFLWKQSAHFLCKSHDITPHKTIASQKGFAQRFQFAWINLHVLPLGKVLKLPKEFTTHICQMKRSHPSRVGWDTIPKQLGLTTSPASGY